MDPMPRWRRRKTARPEEIIEAALAIFTERGFTAARLDEIAARAGVTKGTIYLYFKDKEALLRAVLAANVLPNIEMLEAAIDRTEGPVVEIMRKVMATAAAAMIQSPIGRLPKLMISEAANFPQLAKEFHDQLLSRIFGIHRKLLKRGIAAGEFRKVDVEATARVIQAQILFLCLWHNALAPVFKEPIDIEHHLGIAIDVLVNGLRKS